jgi:predicted RNA binding protein YcfA (HicA-like mRNA interferase family)
MSFKRIDVLAALLRRGFFVLRHTGGHKIVKGPNGEVIAVPRHRELNRFTVRSIANDAGAEWREFRKEL